MAGGQRPDREILPISLAAVSYWPPELLEMMVHDPHPLSIGLHGPRANDFSFNRTCGPSLAAYRGRA